MLQKLVLRLSFFIVTHNISQQCLVHTFVQNYSKNVAITEGLSRTQLSKGMVKKNSANL